MLLRSLMKRLVKCPKLISHTHTLALMKIPGDVLLVQIS